MVVWPERQPTLPPGQSSFGGLVYRSAQMAALVEEALVLARSRLPLALTGPSGTGKTRLAAALHSASGRGGAFEVVDCGAIDGSLLRAELFGAVRGAFTGCDRDRVGAFQRAHRGTLFLDEIGELPTSDQARLLKGIEEQVFRPVGGGEVVRVDVRVVAATLRDPSSLRTDLWHRLGARLHVPGLDERREDIEPIVLDYMSRRGGGVTRQALRRLEERSWPGNVRELLTAVELAAVRADGAPFDVRHLEPLYSRAAGYTRDDRVAVALCRPRFSLARVARELGLAEEVVWRRARDLVDSALQEHGSERAAARALGWARSTFQDRRRWGELRGKTGSFQAKPAVQFANDVRSPGAATAVGVAISADGVSDPSTYVTLSSGGSAGRIFSRTTFLRSFCEMVRASGGSAG
ncbi:MAG: sigma 54-interacting transcriptional regulator, partial [Myxococcota bacterium]